MKKEDLSIATGVNQQVASTEVVTFTAVTSLYKRRPLFISPLLDNETNVHSFGLVPLTDKQLSVHNSIKDQNSHLSVRNMEHITLSKNKDGAYIVNKEFVKYNLALIQPTIAHSKKEATSTMHDMYISNVEAESKEFISQREVIIEATSKFAALTDEGRYDMLYFFGYNPSKMTPNVRKSTCYKLIDDHAEQVVAFFGNETESAHIIFVKKLLANDLAKKDANGLITCSIGTLGYQEAGAASFLYDSKNDKIFDSLTQALASKIK